MSRLGSSSTTLIGTATTPALTTGPKIQLDIHATDIRFNYFLVIETLP
jgi:hypothetical protein